MLAKRKNFRDQRGFTLIEILVAVVVIAIALLGIASLQASAIGSTAESGINGVASVTVKNLSARMRANRAFWNREISGGANPKIAIFVNDQGDVQLDTDVITSSSPTCDDNQCSPAEIAEYDLREWMLRASQQFVNPQLTVTMMSPGDEQLTINLSWQEKADNSVLRNLATSGGAGRTKSYEVLVRL